MMLSMSGAFFCFFLIFQFATFGHAQNVALEDSSDKKVGRTFSNEFHNKVGIGLSALFGARFTISYERVWNDRFGTRLSFGRRFLSAVPPSYDLLVLSSFGSGFQNLFRINGAARFHYYLKENGFRPYLSLVGGVGNVKIVYVQKETRCNGPSGCITCCQKVPVHKWNKTDYWYVGGGGGFEVPLGRRFSFAGDIELGVLSPIAEYHDKIEVFHRRFAWFLSTRVDYKF